MIFFYQYDTTLNLASSPFQILSSGLDPFIFTQAVRQDSVKLEFEACMFCISPLISLSQV